MSPEIELRGAATPAPPGMAWKGVPPENGTLRVLHDFLNDRRLLYLDGELLGEITLSMMVETLSPLVVDWDAWRASKVPA